MRELAAFDEMLDEIERLSIAVSELVDRGHLDEAERTCRELERRFPDHVDWMERSAFVCEARGEKHKAAEYYRRCVDFANKHSDSFAEDWKEYYRDKVAELGG